jgi:hypothetical protein
MNDIIWVEIDVKIFVCFTKETGKVIASSRRCWGCTRSFTS